jgi:crotonobetainyl-CoA:carnitine CoA-transferase CaiB-like acyl-CoA transferase
MKTRTAQEWEDFLQENHVPAARIWRLSETLAHAQMESRDVLHRFPEAPGVPGSFGVPMAAFKLAHGGAHIDSPPPRFGEHNDEVLSEIGYSRDEIGKLRQDKIIGEAPETSS